MTLGYNPSERGISLKSASDEEIRYLERRFSGKIKSIGEILEYGDLIIPWNIKGNLTPLQKKLLVFTEPFFREVSGFYLTYVQ